MIDLATVIFKSIAEDHVPARRIATSFATLLEAAEYACKVSYSPSSREAIEMALLDIKQLLKMGDGDGRD